MLPPDSLSVVSIKPEIIVWRWSYCCDGSKSRLWSTRGLPQVTIARLDLAPQYVPHILAGVDVGYLFTSFSFLFIRENESIAMAWMMLGIEPGTPCLQVSHSTTGSPTWLKCVVFWWTEATYVCDFTTPRLLYRREEERGKRGEKEEERDMFFTALSCF